MKHIVVVVALLLSACATSSGGPDDYEAAVQSATQVVDRVLDGVGSEPGFIAARRRTLENVCEPRDDLAQHFEMVFIETASRDASGRIVDAIVDVIAELASDDYVVNSHDAGSAISLDLFGGKAANGGLTMSAVASGGNPGVFLDVWTGCYDYP